MKRKVVMMGLAMIAGVPHAVCAREGAVQSYSSWNAPFMPHYGTEGSTHPLMDHLSAPAPQRSSGNAWRMEFVPPAAASRTDDPLSAKDRRVGLTFRLDF
jgi:hypothetical protein